MVNIHSPSDVFKTTSLENSMSLKALIRRLTGKGGALNRATSARDVCRLNTIAMAARVSVWDLD